MNPAEDGDKRTVRGRVVKVLVHTRDDRGMVLEPFASRCVRHGEIHELVCVRSVRQIVVGEH